MGGGNFGDLYLGDEIIRRKTVEEFPKNKIIIMPQTITYTDTNTGKEELEKTKKIFSSHKNLTIICREEKSYKFALDNFKYNNIILCPDIVFYLEDNYIKKDDIQRDGVLFCFRKDKEKILKEEVRSKIFQYLDTNQINYSISDTVVKRSIKKDKRKIEVENLIKQISSSKVLITDRLHGMILAFITNTPALVFKSFDHKVEKSYQWLKDYKYIKYVGEEIDDFTLEKTLKELLNLKVEKKEYKLKEKIKEILKNLI